jgi:excisionase family DNA binding protein
LKVFCRRLEILLKRVGAMSQTTADSTDTGRFLKLSEAASMVGIGKTTFYAAIRRGDLRVVHLGRSIRIRATELDAWLSCHEDPAR